MVPEKEKAGFPVIPSDREDDLHNLDFADSADWEPIHGHGRTDSCIPGRTRRRREDLL